MTIPRRLTSFLFQINANAFVVEEDREEPWDNLPFLNACKPWLAHHGYTLYNFTKDEWGNTQGTPSLPPPELSHISYPYSFFSWYAHRPVVPCGSFQVSSTSHFCWFGLRLLDYLDAYHLRPGHPAPRCCHENSRKGFPGIFGVSRSLRIYQASYISSRCYASR